MQYSFRNIWTLWKFYPKMIHPSCLDCQRTSIELGSKELLGKSFQNWRVSNIYLLLYDQITNVDFISFSDVDISKNFSFKFDKDKFCKSLTPYMSFWKKLNQGQQFLSMTNEDIKSYGSAVQLFIKEEFNFALSLLRTIHQSFAKLNKICKELINPQTEDMNLSLSLMNHEVITVNYFVNNSVIEKIFFFKQF